MRRHRFSAARVGLPPGTLLHVGHARSDVSTITAIGITEAGMTNRQNVPLAEVQLCMEGEGILWLQVAGLSHVKTVETVGELFRIHPLVLEDILNTNQRPKIEDYGEYLYLAMQMPDYLLPSGDTSGEQIHIILGRRFVITFQESQRSLFRPIEERLNGGADHFFRHGSDYLAYAIIDTVVDHYFVALEQAGERVEELEDQLITQPREDLLPAIHDLKKTLIALRRSVWPLREVIAGIERSPSSLFQEGTFLYVRDVYDHVVEVMETLETYRDMVSGMIDIYLSSVSNRLNEVVKVLAVISTIFMPLTFLAGVYGMNFEHMPELKSQYGYPAVLLAMFITGLSMFRYFKNRGWI